MSIACNAGPIGTCKGSRPSHGRFIAHRDASPPVSVDAIHAASVDETKSAAFHAVSSVDETKSTVFTASLSVDQLESANLHTLLSVDGPTSIV